MDAKASITTSAYASDMPMLRFLTENAAKFPYIKDVSHGFSTKAEDLLPEHATVQSVYDALSWRVVVAVDNLAQYLIETRENSSTRIIIGAKTEEGLDDAWADVSPRIPTPPVSQDSCRIRSWYHAGSSYSGTWRTIGVSPWEDIRQNYPARTVHRVEDLLSVRDPEGYGKLVLWHGPPGTGKTTALGALLKGWEDWCDGQYIVDPEKFFNDAGYIAEVLTNGKTSRWRLVIAEDTDEYLRATARSNAGASLGRLLNLTDGILGQGAKTLVLLTTNEEISRLHPAIVRPGRCLSNIEFPAFNVEEASNWLGKHATKEMTLAEMYAAKGALKEHGDSSSGLAVGQYL